MSLIGGLLGGIDSGGGPAPQPTSTPPARTAEPAPAPTAGPAKPEASQSEPAAPPPSGPPAPAASTGSAGPTAAARAERPAAGPRPSAGTPVEAPAVRRDFATLEGSEMTKDLSRAYTLAAQEAAKTEALVGGIESRAEAPKLVSEAVPAGRETPAYAEPLEALRGQADPVGAMLDRAA